jgi:hypothetical protein
MYETFRTTYQVNFISVHLSVFSTDRIDRFIIINLFYVFINLLTYLFMYFTNHFYSFLFIYLLIYVLIYSFMYLLRKLLLRQWS